MTVGFDRIQLYLDRLSSSGSIDVAPHGRFWASYDDFVNRPLPAPLCHGGPIMALAYADAAKTTIDVENCPFLIALLRGYCGQDQMPPTGPDLADPAVMIDLDAQTRISSGQMLADIRAWLRAGAPEHAP